MNTPSRGPLHIPMGLWSSKPLCHVWPKYPEPCGRRHHGGAPYGQNGGYFPAFKKFDPDGNLSEVQMLGSVIWHHLLGIKALDVRDDHADVIKQTLTYYHLRVVVTRGICGSKDQPTAEEKQAKIAKLFAMHPWLSAVFHKSFTEHTRPCCGLRIGISMSTEEFEGLLDIVHRARRDGRM